MQQTTAFGTPFNYSVAGLTSSPSISIKNSIGFAPSQTLRLNYQTSIHSNGSFSSELEEKENRIR